MRAVEARGAGGSDVLAIVHAPRPDPKAGEVLIEIAAAGVNRADIMQREGRYDPPPGTDTSVLGLECAGRVVAVGEGVSADHLGQPVCALLAGGGYAEYVTVPVEQTARLPRGATWEQAAALPEAAATVWSNLVMRGRLATGERVLVHSGASGVGAMAIQVAVALQAEVVATVGSPEKAGFCRRLGARHVLIRGQDDFVAALSSPGERVDIVFDLVGGPYLSGNVAVLRREGRLVQVGLLGGAIGSLDLSEVLNRNLTITGSGLRNRPMAEKGRIITALQEQLWPLVERGAVRPTVDTVVPLDEVRTAHDRLEAGHIRGKVVLRVANHQPV